MFQESFEGASHKFQGYFKKVSRISQKSFKGVSKKFQGCFKEVSRAFQGTFKDFSRQFQGIEIQLEFLRGLLILFS